MFRGRMCDLGMFGAPRGLRPLADAAKILARHDSWPSLYDPARLSANEVPVAAAVYYDDMYVPQQFSVDTAAKIGGMRRWVTSEYQHDGLRITGGAVPGPLTRLVRGIIYPPPPRCPPPT